MNIGLIIAILILILFSAYFSATETAFSSLNKIRLKNMAANDGNKRAAATLAVVENYDRLLTSTLIGNNIVNITSASLSTVLFTAIFVHNGVTVSTVVMTVVVLIFGEIVPKSLAKEKPEEFAMFSTPLLKFLMVVLQPLNWIFMGIKKGIMKLFKISTHRSFTEDELITMIDEVENEGVIDAHEGDLIRSAIEFDDLLVEDVLIPRVDIVGIEETLPADEIRDVFLSSGFSRIPVYKESIDHIIGVIHEKDFYSQLHKGENTIEPIIKDVLCVAPNMKISDLLRSLQISKSHIAIVVDEFGGTAGLVTLEDILEELVGEIYDEHDEVVELFTKTGENEYLVSCIADLDEFFEYLGLDFDEEDFDTNSVSGFVMENLGKIPEVGDCFTYENMTVCVTQTEMRRVVEIRVTLTPPQEEKSEKPKGKERASDVAKDL